MTENSIINFTCTYKSASFKGYVYEHELDNDNLPVNIYYLTKNNMVTEHLTYNDVMSGNTHDKVWLKDYFEDDDLFLQSLADHIDDSRNGLTVIIDRGDYFVII